MGIHHSHLKLRNLATWRQKPRPSTTQHWTWRCHDTSATVRGVGTTNPRKNHAAEAQPRTKAFHCSAIKTHSKTPHPCHIQSNSVLKNKQGFTRHGVHLDIFMNRTKAREINTVTVSGSMKVQSRSFTNGYVKFRMRKEKPGESRWSLFNLLLWRHKENRGDRLVKCLLHKSKDLSSIPRIHIKRSPCDDTDRWIPASNRQTSLAKWVSSKLGETLSQREKKKRRKRHLRNTIDVRRSALLTTCTHTYTHTVTHSQTKTKDCIWWRLAQLVKNCSTNAFYLLIASKLDLTLYRHWGKYQEKVFEKGAGGVYSPWPSVPATLIVGAVFEVCTYGHHHL